MAKRVIGQIQRKDKERNSFINPSNAKTSGYPWETSLPTEPSGTRVVRNQWIGWDGNDQTTASGTKFEQQQQPSSTSLASVIVARTTLTTTIITTITTTTTETTTTGALFAHNSLKNKILKTKNEQRPKKPHATSFGALYWNKELIKEIPKWMEIWEEGICDLGLWNIVLWQRAAQLTWGTVAARQMWVPAILRGSGDIPWDYSLSWLTMNHCVSKNSPSTKCILTSFPKKLN